MLFSCQFNIINKRNEFDMCQMSHWKLDKKWIKMFYSYTNYLRNIIKIGTMVINQNYDLNTIYSLVIQLIKYENCQIEIRN